MDFRNEKQYLDCFQSSIVQIGANLWFPTRTNFEYLLHHQRMWCRTCDLIFSYELKHRFLGYDNHGDRSYTRISSVKCSLGKCQNLPFCSYKCIKQHIQKEHYDLPTRLTIFEREDVQGDRLGRLMIIVPRQRVVTLIGNVGQPNVTDLEQKLYANTRV